MLLCTRRGCFIVPQSERHLGVTEVQFKFLAVKERVVEMMLCPFRHCVALSWSLRGAQRARQTPSMESFHQLSHVSYYTISLQENNSIHHLLSNRTHVAMRTSSRQGQVHPAAEQLIVLGLRARHSTPRACGNAIWEGPFHHRVSRETLQTSNVSFSC